MKKNGFTLVEMLAVIIILGVLLGLGVSAYSRYLASSRRKSYEIAENSMKSATIDAVTNCLTGEGKDREFCQKHHLVENQYEYELVYLKELIDGDYIDAIRDPSDTNLVCDSEQSYVYITNKEDTNQVNNGEFDYKVCLICSKYKSEDCLEDIEENNEGNYNAYCKVSYDEAGLVPYDGTWTDKDLYLTLTVDGKYKYGISYFTYQFGSNSKKVKALEDKVIASLKETIDNEEVTVVATDGMNENSRKGSCGIIKVDKEKIISAKITGKLNVKKTEISSDEWASEDVLLTVTTNPKKIPSGALYQWYKDGEKIGEETTSNTYIATEDGTYYAEVTNTLHNQQVKTNEFKVKIDRVAPTIVVKQNPISLGTQDYNFIDNVTYTFSISGGSTKCSPASTKKTGSYTVTCVATGGNKLTASVSFTARHSYAATYESKTCTRKECTSYTCKACTEPGGECCGWSWDGGCGGDMSSCSPSQECTGGWSCGCKKYATGVCCGYKDVSYECGSYKCKNGGTLNNSDKMCYY